MMQTKCSTGVVRKKGSVEGLQGRPLLPSSTFSHFEIPFATVFGVQMKIHRDSTFTDEIEIVWHLDPQLFPFAREALASTRGLTRPISNNQKDGRVIVGYAVKKRGFWGVGLRRFFYIMPYDFLPEEAAWQPMEAVDPLTVSPGVAGEATERCEAQPTPEQAAAIAAILEERRAYLQHKRDLATARQRKHREPTPEQKKRDARNARKRARYAEKN